MTTVKDTKQTINSAINHWMKIAKNISVWAEDGDWTDSNKETMISILKHWQHQAEKK